MKDLITAAEFERDMQNILEEYSHTRDTEKAHKQADQLMCDALTSLGYSAGVKVFERLGKFYA